MLGEGGFGKVMLGEHKGTKEKVAIKFVHTSRYRIYIIKKKNINLLFTLFSYII